MSLHKSTSSTNFGRIFHELIECSLQKVPYTLTARSDFKKTDFYKEQIKGMPGEKEMYRFVEQVGSILFTCQPAEIPKLESMMEQFQSVKETMGQGWTGETETAFFTSHKELCDFKGELPSVLVPILDILIECGLGLKTKIDFIKHTPTTIHLYDWKSTTKESIDEMRHQIYGYYQYLLSLLVYALNLYLRGVIRGDREFKMSLVMFTKTEDPISPVVFNFDINNLPSHLTEPLKNRLPVYMQVYEKAVRCGPIFVDEDVI